MPGDQVPNLAKSVHSDLHFVSQGCGWHCIRSDCRTGRSREPEPCIEILGYMSCLQCDRLLKKNFFWHLDWELFFFFFLTSELLALISLGY
jgi:hypothetical protein